jgi:hypothetical protein
MLLLLVLLLVLLLSEGAYAITFLPTNKFGILVQVSNFSFYFFSSIFRM